ncbi:hypothetical protein RIF29_25767 [Crotalaria pallida]|uniref:Uncharacterized protein n=1 Tax=Crotalaria pallida TaxID=3830 RepID=A0AAN9EP75_CROPI
MYGHRADVCIDTGMSNGDELLVANEMVDATTIVSDTVVVTNGSYEIPKESANVQEKKNNTNPDMNPSIDEDKEQIKENPFGPWMLVKRFPKNRERGGQKGGNSKVDHAIKKGQSVNMASSNNNGSRFNALIEINNGEVMEGITQHDTCVLHEENPKENNMVIVAGPSIEKKEIPKDFKARNLSGGKNHQNRGPKAQTSISKPKAGRGEPSPPGNPLTMLICPSKSIQAAPKHMQHGNADSGLRRKF